jgi:ParB/RepB/Spo0J family partition protein
MHVESLAMASLIVSEHNCRTAKLKPEDYADLVASIKSIGLLSPLVVVAKGKKYEIIAGQRRFMALQELGFESVPCYLVATGESGMMEISLAENFTRRDLTPIQEFKAFKCMVDKLSSDQTGNVGAIMNTAASFNVPPLYVTQRLRLADLPDDVLKYAEKNDIGIDILEALTVAPRAKQKEWLAAAKKGEHWAESAQSIRRQSTANRPHTGQAVFELGRYTGTFIEDLFENRSYFNDTKQFEELQSEELLRVKEEYLAKGWSWVQTFVSERPSIWQFEKSKKKDIAGVVIYVDAKKDEAGHRILDQHEIVIETGLVDAAKVKELERAKKKEEAKERKELGTEEEVANDRPLTAIMSAVHDYMARASNGAAIKAIKNEHDLLMVICDMIADGNIRFDKPQSQHADQFGEIVGNLIPATPGTFDMRAKLRPTQRLKLLRELMAGNVGRTQISVAPVGIRELWTPNETYFNKLDKGRLALCFNAIGMTESGVALLDGKTSKKAAVEMLSKIFVGDENYSTSKMTKKLADAWVPPEFREAQKAREFSAPDEEEREAA